MSEAVMNLLPQLEALTDVERNELRGHLDGMKEGELSPEEADAAWLPVLDRRSHELNSGLVKGLTREEFFRALDADREARE